MHKYPTRAMIFAAGFGTRLGDLGVHLPKPLLPVCGWPILAWNLHWLKSQGIEDVVINLHHHAVQIKEQLGDGQAFGLNILYSEEPEILGTGGGLKYAWSKLVQDDRPILLMNGKLIFDLDLGPLLDMHHRHQAWATLVLREDNDPKWGAYFSVDKHGRFADFDLLDPARHRQGTHMFAGIHVIDPKLVRYFPEDGFACIARSTYRELWGARPQGLRGYVMPTTHAMRWREHSTPEHYAQSVFDILAHHQAFEAPTPEVGIHPKAKVHPDATIHGPVHIEAGAQIHAGAQVGPFVSIGRDAVVEKGHILRHAIVGAGVQVPHSLDHQIMLDAGHLITLPSS